MIQQPEDLASEMRRLREESGLSLRAWAGRLEIPLATLSRVERGGDIGWSSACRLLQRLPELSPRALLGPRASGPRPASSRTWTAWAELVGFRSDRVVTSLGEDGLVTIEVEGLRTTRASLRDKERRIAVLGAVLVGSPELAYELERTEELPFGQPRLIETDEAVHELSVPEDPDREGLGYRCTTRPGRRGVFPHGTLEGPFAQGLSCWIDHPTESLVLRTPAALGAVAPWAWPPSLAPSAEATLELWHRLHPHAPRALSSGSSATELRIERPTLGLAHGLSPAEPATTGEHAPTPGPVVARPLAPSEPASVLAAARCADELSQRELAERVGCSPATICRLEAGSEPRLSLVRACLEALPAACAFELLPCPETPPTPDEIWEEQRALFGMESREERRRIQFEADGTAQIESRSVGITWDAFHGEELGLRFGTGRSPSVAPDWELEAVGSRPSSDGTRVRVVKRSSGGAVHELRLEASDRADRLDLVRRMALSGSRPAAMVRSEEGDRRTNNVFLTPTVPCRAMSAELLLPEIAVPTSAKVTCTPRSCPPMEGSQDLSGRLRPEGLQAEVDPARRRVRFRMERPLVGLRVALTWEC